MRGAISAKTQFFSPEVACDKATPVAVMILLVPSYFVAIHLPSIVVVVKATLTLLQAYPMPLSVCGSMPIDWLTAS